MRRTFLATAAILIVLAATLVTPSRTVHCGDSELPRKPTPIIVDLAHDGFELTDKANGTHFFQGGLRAHSSAKSSSSARSRSPRQGTQRSMYCTP